MSNAERIKEHVKHLRLRIERLRALQNVTLAEYAANFDKRDLAVCRRCYWLGG